MTRRKNDSFEFDSRDMYIMWRFQDDDEYIDRERFENTGTLLKNMRLHIKLGGDVHYLYFKYTGRSGDRGWHQIEGRERQSLHESNHPFLHSARYKAVEAYFRAQINEPYELDYSEVIGKGGFTLGHWSAMNNFLPENFKQWMLRDKYNMTVLETALRHETLPRGFKDFGMSFKYQEKDITAADFIKRCRIPAYIDAVAEYEKREARNTEKNSTRAALA